MDKFNQLREVPSGSRDSTLDTTSLPSETFATANESTSKYFSLSEDDSTFDLSSIKDVSVATTAPASDGTITNTEELISNLSPINKENYKIGKQIEAANILSGGVNIFDDNDNSYDGDELVIDDNVEEEKSNTNLKASECIPGTMESSLIQEDADIASKDTEVVLQIDGKNLDAIDIGNGLYLYRKEGEEELAAVQISDDDQHQPSFKFLKVRENAEGNLEVYEEIEIEVPNKVPNREGKTVNKTTSSHVPIKDINKVINEPTSNKVCDGKSSCKESVATSIIVEDKSIKNSGSENKSEVNLNGKMMKFSESRKSPVIGSFTPMTYHSTPNKEGKPLTKTMVDLQLHPSRHSDNVKKTIEVHTDNSKPKAHHEAPHKSKEDLQNTEVLLNLEENNRDETSICAKQLGNLDNLTVTGSDTCIKEDDDIDSDAKILQDVTEIMKEQDIQILPEVTHVSDPISVPINDITNNSITKLPVNKEEIVLLHSGVGSEEKERNIPSLVLEDISKDAESKSNFRDHESQVANKDVEHITDESENNANDIMVTTVAPAADSSGAKVIPNEEETTKTPLFENIESNIIRTNIDELEISESKIASNNQSTTVDTCTHNKSDDNINYDNLRDSKRENENELDMSSSPCKDHIPKVVNKSGKAVLNTVIEKKVISSKDTTDAPKLTDLCEIETKDSKSSIYQFESAQCVQEAFKNILSTKIPNMEEKIKETSVKLNILKSPCVSDKAIIITSELKDVNKGVVSELQNAKKDIHLVAQTTKQETIGKKSETLDDNIKTNQNDSVLENDVKIDTSNTQVEQVDETITTNNTKVTHSATSSNVTTKKQIIKPTIAKTISVPEINIIPKPSDKKEITKMNTEIKPINNNHTAVPFGKWTEANRQEFLNKFKSKVPTTSSNTNQIKNSNDLNRRDVLKKIDSQRQTSNALAKAQDLNKLSIKNETAFSKGNLLTQDSKIPLKSEALELKVKPTIEKNVLKTETKETISNKSLTPPLTSKNVINTNLSKKDLKVCSKAEVGNQQPLLKNNVVSNTVPKKVPMQRAEINSLNPVKIVVREVSKTGPKQKSEVSYQDPNPLKSIPNDDKSKTELKRRTESINQGTLPSKKIISDSVPQTERKPTDIKNQGSTPEPIKHTVSENVSKKEQLQRTEVNYQDLIDKTIEGMLHRGIPTKTGDESKQNPENESSSTTNKGSYKQNYPSMDEFATLDAIEMKMNELHGIPFIERPPHELPKVLKSDTKNQSKSDIDKPAAKSSKGSSSVLPCTNKLQENAVNDKSTDVDSEEEIIEHEPVTGDIELNKKKNITISSGQVKINSNVDKHSSDSSKHDPIITEKDFDKFARRNSMTYENRITVNFETKESHNVVQTVVPKDYATKDISKSDVIILDPKTKPSYQNIHKAKNDSDFAIKRNSTNNFGSANEDTGSRNQSKVQKAYQSALTAKRQLECPITIIEDKPVKVVYMDTIEFTPNHLDVQGQDLSPAKKLTSESDLIFTGSTMDSEMLDNINDIKAQDETKVKTKHQRKQVLTPVAEPELELIEPRDLGIDSPNKKKRKTEEDKTDKSVKHMMRKKMYLLSSVEENQHNVKEIKKPFAETAKLNESMRTHQTHVSAIDNLVKAAELIEHQSENAISVTGSISQAQLDTPVKRGRGRPRKYPIQDGATDVKNKEPSPQKKPRLIDAKPVKRDIVSDEEDEDSSDEIIRENWTMGKINENIVCPICNKLFRTENVVFKHVKHCTGPSPSRSDSDKRSPRRMRDSQESDDTLVSKFDYIDDEDDKPIRRRVETETFKKHKSKSSIHHLEVDKDDVILIDDTPDKDKPVKVDDRKQHESRKHKSKLPLKNNDLVCEFCGKSFRQLSYLVSHKLQHKKDEPKKPDKEVPLVSKSVHSCEVCKKAFRKLHHLVQHRIIHNPTSLPMRSLRKSSSEQSEHKSDKSRSSSKQSEDASAGFRCEPCDKSFRKLHHLVEHRETHDGINRQKNTSVTQNVIEKPVMTHVCDICKKTFKKLQHLLEHKEQHLDTCSEKSDDKSVKSSLSTKDIIHECALCYMVFPNEHSLNKHTIICQRKKRKSKQKPGEDAETTDETSEELKIDENAEDKAKISNENTEKTVNVSDIKTESFLKDKIIEMLDKPVELTHNTEIIPKTECHILNETKETIGKTPKRQNIVTPTKIDNPESSTDSEEILMSDKIKKGTETSEKINKIIETSELVKERVAEKSRKEVEVAKRTNDALSSAKSELEVLEKINIFANVTEKNKKDPAVTEKSKTVVLPEKVRKETVTEKVKKDFPKINKDDLVLKTINKNEEIHETVKPNPEVTDKVNKSSKEIKTIINASKKETPAKDKPISKPKRLQTAPTIAVKEPKPVAESSDDDEIRYMLNPDFKVEETEEKVFMRVKAQKRNSFQIERPNSKDLMKRRISLQHPPKIPRLKQKQNESVPIKNLVKSVESVPSTDSDDSDVKYSFPKPVPEKPVKENIVKDAERKTPRKLNEKRKTLSGIAKRKSVGKAVIARHKPSPMKQIKRRTMEVEHRCDCGQLFSSAALLTRHTSLAHTPPRIRRRRSPLPEPPKPARKSSEPQPSTASRKSSVRSDTSTSKPKTEARCTRRSTDKGLTEKVSKPDDVKSGVKVKRTSAHRGVPVPEKMKKLMQKNK